MARIITHPVMLPSLLPHVSTLSGFIFAHSERGILGTVGRENEHHTGEVKEGNVPTTFE